MARQVDSPMDTILAVDDHRDALFALERTLKRGGYDVITAASGREALEQAQRYKPSLILLDVMMPDADGYSVTHTLKLDDELKYIPIILLSAHDSLTDVVRGLDEGADGYLSKSCEPDEVLARVRAALRLRKIYSELQRSTGIQERLAEELRGGPEGPTLVGKSGTMERLREMIRKVGATDAAVLITGPSGSGKELVATALHNSSPRHNKPFIAKNCAAFSESLLESELFGYQRGAFTGAEKNRLGLFEAADGGTLFLDEIGEMSPTLQAKLLRVLQDGTFLPVGSTESRHVDVRIVAATNRNLETMIEQGQFREDLFYRLNVVRLELPKLSARREDIPELAQHFLKLALTGKGVMKILSPQVIEYMTAYEWRGNVRELRNEIERLLILGTDDEELSVDLLSNHIRDYVESHRNHGESSAQGTLKRAVEELERKLIRETLTRLSGNKSQASKELGISRSNLIAKVQQYGLE